MSTINTLQSAESGASSMADINTNFANLNTDKQEKGTGVTGNLATFGASNVLGDSGKVAPTGAIVGTTDTQALTNKTLTSPVITNKSSTGADSGVETLTNKTLAAGSNTITGITEAMQTLADNTTGNVSTTKHGYAPKSPNDASKYLDGTGAYSTPAPATTTNIIPRPASTVSGASSVPNGTNTTAICGRLVLTEKITVNYFSVVSGSTATTPGNVKIGIYSSDGQTQYFNGTVNVTGTGTLFTVTLGAPVTLPAGDYYVVWVPSGTTNVGMYNWTSIAAVGSAAAGLTGALGLSKAVLEGTLTVTASTLPTTFTPSAITPADNSTLIIRFDN